MADKVLRCAIYTRKSTEDGLEQEFNSLDAQYEACAAYALSQQHEGWVVLGARYDDGGFSGGNMERPGLKQLLVDIKAGQIDIVLLYKIDRLTRSLADFSKIVEVMDNAGASFVSITQSFNTTTSMGRLTLNMLLSFAQFEREVTGERIRDKIAASKKKGMWMGGPLPLGYEVQDRKLVVNEPGAEQVRHIMRRYIALGTVPLLVKELNKQGYRTKVQRRASGPHKGGCVFRRGTLYHLLSNRIYRGMIVHKDNVYDGEHEAIIDEKLWNAVQERLASNACGSSRRRMRQHPSLLIGKVFDGAGRAMTPSHAQRGSKRYRYYVTRPEEVDGSAAWRVSAHDLEQLVCDQCARRMSDKRFVLELLKGGDFEVADFERVRGNANLLVEQLLNGKFNDRASLLEQIVQRVDLHEDRVEVAMCGTAIGRQLELALVAETQLSITVPAIRVRRGHQLRLIIPGKESSRIAPAQRDDKLIALVAEALEARRLVETNPDKSLASLASDNGRCRTRLGNLAKLSCLAPDIVKAIVEGRQPTGLTAKSLSKVTLPLAWEGQRMQLGFK
ncbi:recombinase family protein [Sphingorhabdus soli]|uniref:Recombinase family protein n=1 Tax=Flavisphingopyxis soli TaxID=2601267 RepID=A0A5C6UK25_9SPHN|nr:recombinase family protein [Sphingorhabdus soli]TXC73362.1 recombinase family protein [Sphingorhabdus soli]